MYTLPDLPYEYDALAPTISEDIMKLHHQKHHQAYVDKLNAAIEQEPSLKEVSLVNILTNLAQVPESVRSTIRNNGGGHYNHSLFWAIMTPGGSGDPSGPLSSALIQKWGSLDAFKNDFNQAALGLFGSGWVWLTKDLEIIALPNQDAPMALGKGEPVMGLDVWEHAYYLDYKNDRKTYIEQWWTVVNWPAVQAKYEA
jgi:Fe-Mn family superoxide dismutase